MPRYRRYTKTIIKPTRKRWNRTFEVFGPSQTATLQGQSGYCLYGSVVYNQKDVEGVSTATPMQGTKIRIMGQINMQDLATESNPATPCFVKAYVTFCPQVVYEQAPNPSQSTVSTVYNYWKALIESNPEYIMGQKTINTKYQGGFPGEKISQNFTLTSGKMKRNLKSGDRIVCIIFIKSLSSQFNAAINCYFESEASVRRN